MPCIACPELAEGDLVFVSGTPWSIISSAIKRGVFRLGAGLVRPRLTQDDIVSNVLRLAGQLTREVGSGGIVSRAGAPAPQTQWFSGQAVTQGPSTRAPLAVLHGRSLRMTEATIVFWSDTTR